MLEHDSEARLNPAWLVLNAEEAVRREVMEEAGIGVGPVAIVGSQPWPIGD